MTRRVLMQEDFDRFAALSGDNNPIHTDPRFAARTHFGRPVAHGMLLFGLISSMEQHADDLAGLLDGLGIERGHIGGISYGGELSLVFALRYSERTRSLIVADAVSRVGPWLRIVVEGWIGAARTRDARTFFNATVPWNFSPEFVRAHPDLMAQALERYAQLDYEAVIRLCECFLAFDVADRLGEIRAPTCVIVGDRDILKGQEYAKEIVQGIPNAELYVITGAGHATCWERPEVFNTIVLGFLAKQTERR